MAQCTLWNYIQYVVIIKVWNSKTWNFIHRGQIFNSTHPHNPTSKKATRIYLKSIRTQEDQRSEDLCVCVCVFGDGIFKYVATIEVYTTFNDWMIRKEATVTAVWSCAKSNFTTFTHDM